MPPRRGRLLLVGCLWLAAGSVAWAQKEPLLLRNRWPSQPLRYIGEWQGEGTMPLPVLTETGEWQRVPFRLGGRMEWEIRPTRKGAEEAVLEVLPKEASLRFTVMEEERRWPVKLPTLRVGLTRQGRVGFVLPMGAEAETQIPPTLFDLPLDHFSWFYPLLFPLLPEEPVEVGKQWEEKAEFPWEEWGEAPPLTLKVVHRVPRWEARGEKDCVLLESEWEAPLLRHRFEIGGQAVFLRTRWRGKFRIWFDPQEGRVQEAEAPLEGQLGLQCLLPNGFLFDGEATMTLLYRLRLQEPMPEGLVVAEETPSPSLPPP